MQEGGHGEGQTTGNESTEYPKRVPQVLHELDSYVGGILGRRLMAVIRLQSISVGGINSNYSRRK